MQVVHAVPEDARAVAEIHVDAWRSAYSRILPADYLASLSVEKREAMWKNIVESGQTELLVAKDGGAILGWVSFGACRDKDAPSSQAELWAIYVAPNSWFKGVGRQL
ncbi:GNAT family N-acetyltransferase [Acidithiobacillus ferridurans]|nr:GNAT family N-acetyltransferase [Acidithiobacillus ferridurans]